MEKFIEMGRGGLYHTLMIYILLFLLFAVISCLEKAAIPKDLHLLFFLLSCSLLVCFAGLRGDIEPDYQNYLDIYNRALNGTPLIEVEKAFVGFNKVLQWFHLPFQSLIFIIAALSITSKAFFFQKYSQNFGLSMLIYFSALFFLFDFIAIRQGLALSIFLFSIPLIYQRRFFLFLIAMILAAQIHISAILLIPGYFFFQLKLSEQLLYGTIIACAIINILRIKVPLMDAILTFFPIPEASVVKVNLYLKENTYAFVSFKQLALGLAFVYLKNKTPEKNKMVNALVNIFVFGILFATLFNGLPQLSYRMKWYFFSSEAILVVYLIEWIAKADLKLTFSLYGLIFLIYGYSLYTLLSEIAGRGEYIIPYRLFIE